MKILSLLTTLAFTAVIEVSTRALNSRVASLYGKRNLLLNKHELQQRQTPTASTPLEPSTPGGGDDFINFLDKRHGLKQRQAHTSTAPPESSTIGGGDDTDFIGLLDNIQAPTSSASPTPLTTGGSYDANFINLLVKR